VRRCDPVGALFVNTVASVSALTRDAVLVLAIAPLLYYVTAVLAGLRFFRKRESGTSSFTPPVSLLKPVRGVDFGSYENFASFCRQNYPDYEMLFAVNDDSDAAVPLIQRLAAEFPDRSIRLISGAERRGSNRKVSNQIALAREARYDILVLTDGDVRVGPEYLRRVVAPFAEQRVGAVTSFYRGIAEKNLGAELEAVGAASDFFAGVLVAEWMEGMKFALGASIVVTRRRLKEIGGFEAIVNMHSDDYELGHRIAKAGGQVLLSHEPVWTMYPAQTVRGFWNHQVRWARTVRLCRPVAYLGVILTLGLPWAAAAALFAPSKSIAAAYLLGYLILRLAMAWTVGVWGVGDEVLSKKLWLVPLRDAIYFAVYLASFASNRITWGDQQFTMEQGRMVPKGEAQTTATARPTAPPRP
jgi:ceramide glucosyltransferase